MTRRPRQMCLLISLIFGVMTLAACATPEHERFAQSSTFTTLPTNPAKAPRRVPKTIVLIHGMFMTPASWGGWKTYFEQAGYRVYVPAWPLHDDTPARMRDRHPDPALGKLSLADVLASYRKFLATLDEPPILIGHSMGGLITQILLQEKRGAAGVVIDSAPPKGVLSFKFSFLRSNWGVISPFADENQAYLPSEGDFAYAFSNCIDAAEGRKVYQRYATPESRLVGKATLGDVATIRYDDKTLPLLFIAGEEDHIIPASLNYSNFEEYEDAPSLTEFKLFKGRCHWIVGQSGWQEVAQYTKEWLERL